MDFTADLPSYYADFGADATHTAAVGGAVTAGQVILDQPGQTLIGGEILATDYSLRYPAATFPAVKRGDTFLVGGITYTAREAAQPLLDGLEHIVPLSR
jgi:hypothetical protein